MTLSPEARALRGFATDFLTSHDVSAVEWVMDPAYRLSIGGHVFDGRDTQYLPATAAQLDQFPGLTVTVHDAILGPMAWRCASPNMARRCETTAAWPPGAVSRCSACVTDG